MTTTDSRTDTYTWNQGKSPFHSDDETVPISEDLHSYDVTLRDGAQTPGVAFSPTERREIARLLEEFGVGYIEAGYPARETTEQTIEPVLKETTDTTVVGLTSLEQAEIDAVLDCGLDAISIYVRGSSIHRQHHNSITIDEMYDRVRDAVTYATDHGLEVRFAVVDGTRTEPAVLGEFAEIAVDSGADMFGISDSVGVLTPSASYNIVSTIRDRIECPISVHYHDDMGLAVGNTLAAVEAGATQLHTTVNGIGANAGNTPLSAIATALAVRHDRKIGLLEHLPNLSRTVEEYSGVAKSPMAPVVGENAFRYSGPPRSDGVRTDPALYEGFPPKLVGRQRQIDEK